MDRSPEMAGDLGYRKAIEVPQGENGLMVWTQRCQYLAGPVGVQALVPEILIDHWSLVGPGKVALLGGASAPVVDQLVPRNANEPGDREARDGPAPNGVHRRQERLGGEVFSHRLVAAPR